SQFSQLIARRVREANVYCELVPGTTPWSELERRNPSGLILSGGPASVYDAGAPQVDPEALRSGVPVLGICYGMQLIAHHLGGKVDPGRARSSPKRQRASARRSAAVASSAPFRAASTRRSPPRWCTAQWATSSHASSSTTASCARRSRSACSR